MSQFRVSRHNRFKHNETEYILSLIYVRLWDLYKQRRNPEEAGALTYALHRFIQNKIGPPVYPRVWGVDEDGAPRFNWNLLYAHLVEWSTFMEADDNVTIPEEVAVSG